MSFQQLVALTGGSNAFGRLLVADSFRAGGGKVLAAVDVFHDDGPWVRGDDYDGAKALLSYRRGDAVSGLSVTAMGYDASWLSTDQVPRRAVESGLVDRFGLIDPGPRGSTGRYGLAAELHRGGADRLTTVGAYLLRYDFDLVSNFTYFLEVFNLLDRDDSDVEYFYASRLPGEPSGGVEDVHFHPVERRSARLVTSWRF